MKKQVITFDFDETLSRGPAWVLGLLATLLRDPTKEVHIVTRRFGPGPDGYTEHQEVWDFAHRAGIPRDRVHFVNRQWKYTKLVELGSTMHVDDDQDDLYRIAAALPSCVLVVSR